MSIKNYALKGNIIFAPTLDTLETYENNYLIVENNCILGIYKELPEGHKDIEVVDYGNSLIIPGLVDLHIHAPQYAMRGVGMDLQLIDWLNTYTFKTEKLFDNAAFAQDIYAKLVSELVKKGTTRVCFFSSIHTEATTLLMEELEKSGITAYVGKVNMDRNAPPYLCETTETSIQDTLAWLNTSIDHYKNVLPIITPRFVPSCTGLLMQELGKIAQAHNLPIQSHLCENIGEIQWVKELHPDCKTYTEVYEKFALLNDKTIMAHCVHLDETEIHLLKKRGVTIAHCPDSNINLSSGIAPIRKLLNEGLKIGLGSDIAGGSKLCILDVMAEAIKVSKLRWALLEDKEHPLTVANAYYLGTNAEFFGAKAGFVSGELLHAVVLDDTHIANTANLSLAERAERILYLSDERKIMAVYGNGVKLV